MKKIVSTVLALAAVAGGTLALTAAKYHHGGPAHLEQMINHRVDKMLDDVKATDTQRQQILAIKDKLLADGKALRASQADVRKQLLAQWNADQPDTAQVHALVDGRADATKKFADEVADALVQVHGILTPEQRATVAQKLQQHHHGAQAPAAE
jgi:Spy/CpxP family protein refolding chaperone